MLQMHVTDAYHLIGINQTFSFHLCMTDLPTSRDEIVSELYKFKFD